MKSLKVKIIILLIVTGLVFFLGRTIFQKKEVQTNTPASTTAPTQSNQPNEPPKIVSTKPEPLEESIISAAEIIEVSFNRPLENRGEFKLRVEPKIEFEIELTQDRKTAKIKPLKPYELGRTYTLFIGPETKFDGVGRWGQEKVYHVRTIKYRGI